MRTGVCLSVKRHQSHKVGQVSEMAALVSMLTTDGCYSTVDDVQWYC